MKYSDEQLKKELDIDDATLARFKNVRAAAIVEAKMRAQRSGPLKALGISGSSRSHFDTAAEDSNSEFLLKEALAELERLGAKTELAALRKYDIQPCRACYSTTNAQ